MNDTKLGCLDRLELDAADLVIAHPPVLRNGHKLEVYRAIGGATARGRVGYTRWAERPLPERVGDRRAALSASPDVFLYEGDDAGAWYVNFADPRLFVAYGSGLLAQDELQVLEHPTLGSLREALLARRLPAVTEEAGGPTPVLVTGVERRCALDTTPDLPRPRGLYGNQFAAAPWKSIESALTILDPPTRTNLIAMAAPVGSGGYRRDELARILSTAWTAFSAAAEESRRLWPAAPVHVHTGFWGCGAFGGNRTVMVALQIVAAHLSGLDHLTFHAFDASGIHDYDEGATCARALAEEGTTAALLDRLLARGLPWGVGDGN